MKRILASTLVFFCLQSFFASAQWYLFPGSQQVEPDSCQVQVADSTLVNEFVLDIPSVIKVSLALPLGSKRQPSSNFYEFYCGAMLAAKELGESGVNISLNVFDTLDESCPLSSTILSDADVAIGPVSLKDILVVLAGCEETKYVVSPLEPKAQSLVDSSYVVQVPVSNNAQISALVDWIKAEESSYDRLYLLTDDVLAPTASQQYLAEMLDSAGVAYSPLSKVKEMAVSLPGRMAFVTVSDSDQALSAALRDVSALGKTDPDVMLFTTSKIRNLDVQDPAALYNAGTHMVGTYHVDYSNPAVRRFVLAYRSLFNGEPGQFAFHGYDTFHYFVQMCATYGRQWYKKLPEYSERGLQADFNFNESSAVGNSNIAVRRIVYGRDFSMTVK